MIALNSSLLASEVERDSLQPRRLPVFLFHPAVWFTEAGRANMEQVRIESMRHQCSLVVVASAEMQSLFTNESPSGPTASVPKFDLWVTRIVVSLSVISESHEEAISIPNTSLAGADQRWHTSGDHHDASMLA
eukprot:2958262-Rhodomonas_salina.2